MKIKLLILILFIIAPIFAGAQQKSHQQMLDVKKDSLDAILAAFTGSPESFDALINTGAAGLKIAKNGEYEYLFLFRQAMGTGYYYKQDFDAAAANFEAAYGEAIKGKMIEKSTKPLGNLVSIYHYMGLQAKADIAAQKLKQIVETVDTLKNKGTIYYNLGLYNQQQKSFYSIALDNFLKAAEQYKSIADTATLTKQKTDYGTMLMMVAEVYLYLKQPEKALQYLEYIKPYLSLSKVVDISAYGKFVRSYVQLNNKAEALVYYNLLQKTATSTPGNWSELVSSNLQMAELALKEKNFAQAKLYINKADKQSKLDNKQVMVSSVNLSYGDYYKALGDYKQAIVYYKMSETESAIYSKEQYADLLKSLTSVQILAGNKEDAVKTFDKYVTISDSLTSQKTQLNLAEMEAIFQNKNKQQQIETKNIQLSSAHTQKLWLIAGLALALLCALLLVVVYRNKKRTAQLLDGKNKKLSQLNNALEEANHTKAKLFSIISHDLRSPISQVYQFLKLQQLNPNALNEVQKDELSTKIQTATGSLLETMEDLLLWSKTQMSEFKTTVQSTKLLPIITDCQNLLQLNTDAKNIRYQNLIDENTSLKTDPYYLQTIIRNLLQNAVKASPVNAEIVLGTENTSNDFVFYIQNEGGSFTEEQYKKIISSEESAKSLNGLGLRLVDELSQKIGATVIFKSTNNSATRVEIRVPYQ